MAVDQKIIEGCIAGKRRAQSQLYQKFAAGMLGVCLRYCRNREDAEDILQEGFIKVFRSIQTFRGESSIGAWIKRIMINTAITNNKKMISNGIDKMELRDIDDYEATDVDDIELYPIEPEKLLGYIQQLPEGYRTVLNLYVFEGYSHKEIATTMNISENTSKTQLFKARKFLQNKLVNIVSESQKIINGKGI